MPGAILPNMGLQLPELGGDSGDWDDLLNDMFEVVDEHDHTAGKGVLIPTAGIDIDADLPFAGYGPTGLGKAAFNAVTALTSGSKTLFVSSADNELYWRTNAGVNVKLTNGSSINTTLVGGIVGDYASVGAEVAYDDANDRYTFKQQGSPKPWARLASGDVRLYEFNTTETVYVGLKAPAALASSYDVTLPLAVPASTAIVLMSSAGVLSASNTVPNAVTFSTSLTTPTFGGNPTFTGNVFISGGVDIALASTISGALTCESTVQISDALTLDNDLKHSSTFVLTIPGVDLIGGNVTFSALPIRANIVAATTCYKAIPLKTGDRITTITTSILGDGSADITNYEVVKTSAAGVDTSLGTTTSTNPAASWNNLTLDVTDSTLAAGEALTLVITTNATGISIGNTRVSYVRP